MLKSLLNFNLDSIKILDAYDLKIIALLFMLVDHLGAVFFPEVLSFRIIGRVSFILYAFMLSEGFVYTHNIKAYISKIALWALLSEIPFDFASYGKLFYWGHQNIFFTLLISILGLYAFNQKIHVIFKVLIALSCCFLAYLIKSDYMWYGVLLIFLFYFLRHYPLLKYFSISILNVVFSLKFFVLQFFAFLGFIPLLLYNGERGKKIGDIYYSFYAIHLLIFGIIKYSLTYFNI